LIADGHHLFADACKDFLEPEFAVVGTVADGCGLISAAFTLKPDVIILDIGMPGVNGLDAGELIKHEMPRTKLVFLSINMNCDVVANAFRKGASGYVTKQSGAVELALAVRKVIRGESYLSPLIAQETVISLLSSKRVPQKQISQRQTEILHLLAEGRSIKQVADVLEIQPITVAFHKYTIMMRLNLNSNAEFLGYAIKCRMTSSRALEAVGHRV
jgi:DNA-binding NarL/FixJ family response regulator